MTAAAGTADTGPTAGASYAGEVSPHILSVGKFKYFFLDRFTKYLSLILIKELGTIFFKTFFGNLVEPSLACMITKTFLFIYSFIYS